MRTVLLTVGIALFLLLAAAHLARAQDSADVAECVVIPYSNVILVNCPHVTPRYHMGCRQDLAREDPGENWYAPDYTENLPALEQWNMCDIPTARSFRGCYRVEFSQGGFWIVFRQSLFPRTAAALLAARDPRASPPDSLASSYYVLQWHCADRNTGQPIEGPYARKFDFGPQAFNSELLQYSNWDFLQPDYFEAYDQVRLGYRDVVGGSGNPHMPGTVEAARHAMEKRSAIFALAAYGAPGAEHAAERGYEVLHQVVEYYVLRHCDRDESRLASVFPGWAGPESWQMDALIDRIYELTNSVQGDPWWMFSDLDVGTEQTTVGRVKWQWAK